MTLNNKLVVHDTEYELNAAYINGALAFRDRVPNSCNPHRFGSTAHDQWDYGHVNESVGEHYRFGRDILSAPRRGTRFEMDPKAPRSDGADIDDAWVWLQRARHGAREAVAA